jgi:hypothetical protein
MTNDDSLPAETEEDAFIPWHPAFLEAIQMELAQYRDVLQFDVEYPLNTEPLKIDLIIIKKIKDMPIEKNIAAMFRAENLVEYKSPTDYISVKDYYKVYGYACLYVSLTNVPITDLTITFVESRYPKELLTHLKEIRGYSVEEERPGIYSVRGDLVPIQIIDNRRLSVEENLWLKELDNDLDVERITRITTEIGRLGKAVQIQAYLDVITRANPEGIEEAIKMSKSALTLEQVFEDVGWIAKWEARGKALGEALGKALGEEKRAIEVARNLLKMGLPMEKIVEATALDLETVKSLAPQEKP